jgi:hypothetical protein
MDNLDINGRLAIVQPATYKKPVLVKLRSKKDRLSGILQNNAAAVEPDVLELNKDDIVCVFTSNTPPPGKVYGATIAPFFAAVKASKWGNIYFYRNLADSERKNLFKALELVYTKFIKTHKIGFVLPIDLEIRDNEGTKQGYYRHGRKNTEHAIALCPTTFIASLKELQHLVIHELGHPLHALYMSDGYKERWVRLYLSYNVLKELTTTDLQTAHTHFVESKELPSQYRKQLSDEPKIIFNAIIKYIATAHHLKLEHLDLMVKEKASDLSKLWPKSKLHLSEIVSPVSKYGNTSPVELWCESLAAYGINAELPHEVKKLVRRTLRSLQPK